ncbi:AGE family epimerase/isomerase [Modestobacter sp. I12A-02628]|uniref:AGE family epimerase/isomerase n=1 Tax=Goekera deserti TaxID=2497753 RepID=A0A7K3W9J9_9ACTN|nr:AGE family epimerase/isomerase [Goekera deserti]NDI49278.1 AGE family epimerase/isomerase [Goekera deserti]NEL53016.1 AGE family epimerase/isomerase [Goekera deserti]
MAPPVPADRPGGAHWLRAETGRLLEFAARSRHPVAGFGWQDDAGAIDPDRPVELWITCRMTHVFALAVLDGYREHAPLLDHGMAGVQAMRDARSGGWHSAVGPAGPVPGTKEAYAHAFVVLAGASATLAGHPAGPALLGDALEVTTGRFLGPDGLVVDTWDEGFTTLDAYRGVNANMHAVEAFLAAADATGDRAWLDRALVIVERIVHGFAAGNSWRLPEHYDEQWQPLLEYNRESPADPFRPYGATIGHGLEWSRLALHLHHALAADAPAWLVDDARRLFDAAVTDGWDADGATGLVYTVDWTGTPVVHERMHWVAAEATATAATLFAVTGEDRYARWYADWWAWIEEHLVDREQGSWRHELDRHNRPSSTVWAGKPDAYHAVQAVVLPRRPLAVSVAGALTRTPLDGT